MVVRERSRQLVPGGHDPGWGGPAVGVVATEAFVDQSLSSSERSSSCHLPQEAGSLVALTEELSSLVVALTEG